MNRFRLIIAAVVAVAVMSLGAAACTPADQAALQTDLTTLGQGIAAIPALIGELIVLNIFAAACRSTPPGCDA
jgi:hypothetical protein